MGDARQNLKGLSVSKRDAVRQTRRRRVDGWALPSLLAIRPSMLAASLLVASTLVASTLVGSMLAGEMK